MRHPSSISSLSDSLAAKVDKPNCIKFKCTCKENKNNVPLFAGSAVVRVDIAHGHSLLSDIAGALLSIALPIVTHVLSLWARAALLASLPHARLLSPALLACHRALVGTVGESHAIGALLCAKENDSNIILLYYNIINS